MDNSPQRNPSSSGRILIVDDDDAVRAGLHDVLVAEGYDVATAVNGIQALASIRRQACDLALVDINMPLLNGWGTISELRRVGRSLPVIIITARPDMRTLANEAGVELMEKPLEIPTLLKRISEIISSPEHGPGTQSTSG